MQMSSYLGTMIYRVACVAAVVWAVVILLWSAYLARPDWTIYTPIAVGGAAVIWGLGGRPEGSSHCSHSKCRNNQSRATKLANIATMLADVAIRGHEWPDRRTILMLLINDHLNDNSLHSAG